MSVTVESSKTAVATLIARACHQTMDGGSRYDDPVAIRLFGGVALAQAAAARETDPDDFARLRGHVADRTVLAEAALRDAVEARDVRQYVVLGAGYDTFAYRQPAWARGLRVYEVDRPATQTAKRLALGYGGIAVPENVTFVPLDFETTSLRDGLTAAGADLSLPVFFSWLGVTVYLTQGAVEATLRAIASLPAGTAVAFTFGRRATDRGWADRAAASGEPWHTRFDPEELRELLTRLGFGTVSLAGPNALATVDARRLP